MRIPSSSLTNILKLYSKVRKHMKSCQLDYEDASYYNDNKPVMSFSQIDAPLFKQQQKLIELTGGSIELKYGSFDGAEYAQWYKREEYDESHMSAALFWSPELKQKGRVDVYPNQIENIEEGIEGDITYRRLRSGYHVMAVVPHTDPRFNYLDKGFWLRVIAKEVGRKKHEYSLIMSRDLTYENIFIYCLIGLQPSLASHLQDGCFINEEEVDLYRVKMEKALDEKFQGTYERLCDLIDVDYQKSTALVMINKLKAGEIATAVFNDINFTATTAEYHTISLEAPEMLSTLQKHINFTQEFDIYQVISHYTSYVNKIFIRDREDEELLVEDYSIPEFKINGIPLTVAYTHSNKQRTINGIRINTHELGTALNRASCYHDLENFNRFLKQISAMSLERTDVLAGGLPVKINRDLNSSQYHDKITPDTCPRLTFKIIKKKINLVIDEENSVLPIQFGKLLTQIKKINRLTNEGWASKTAERRNYKWARAEITKAVTECIIQPKTKVKTEVTAEGGIVAEVTPAVVVAPEAVLGDALAEEVQTDKLHAFDKVKANRLMELLERRKAEALERSKVFLDNAIKQTGAVLTTNNGREVYEVKGAFTTYLVDKENAQVFDKKSKGYICIVNDSHQTSAGYDSVAARLFALKNDSVIQDQVTTLQRFTTQADVEANVDDVIDPDDDDGDDEDNEDIAVEEPAEAPAAV